MRSISNRLAQFQIPINTNPNDPNDPRNALGFDLDVQNRLDHRYVIKIANGFNTTQIASGRNVLLRVTAPL